MEEQTRERERLSQRAAANVSRKALDLKSIDVFRSDPRYCGDGNRIDLSPLPFMRFPTVSRKQKSSPQSEPVIFHIKGLKKGQDDYVDRTIKKAVARMEMAGR